MGLTLKLTNVRAAVKEEAEKLAASKPLRDLSTSEIQFICAHAPDSFPKDYFSTIKVMLSPESLDTLLCICNNEVLAAQVRHLTIGPERLNFAIDDELEQESKRTMNKANREDGDTSSTVSSHHSRNSDELDSYGLLRRQQAEYEERGQDVQSVFLALSKLPNLETLQIGDCRHDSGYLPDGWSPSIGANEMIMKVSGRLKHPEAFLRSRLAEPLFDPPTLDRPVTEYREFGVAFQALQELLMSGRTLPAIELFLYQPVRRDPGMYPSKFGTMPFALSNMGSLRLNIKKLTVVDDISFKDIPWGSPDRRRHRFSFVQLVWMRKLLEACENVEEIVMHCLGETVLSDMFLNNADKFQEGWDKPRGTDVEFKVENFPLKDFLVALDSMKDQLEDLRIDGSDSCVGVDFDYRAKQTGEIGSKMIFEATKTNEPMSFSGATPHSRIIIKAPAGIVSGLAKVIVEMKELLYQRTYEPPESVMEIDGRPDAPIGRANDGVAPETDTQLSNGTEAETPQ